MLGLEYSAVNAKVRYWISYLLKPEDVDYLLDAKINDVKDFIREHEVKIDIQSDKLRIIEGQIKQALIEYVRSIIRYLKGSKAQLMKTWLKSYEIENLKTIARSIVGGTEVDFLYKISPNSKFTLDAVKSIQTFTEFKELLRDTEYNPLTSWVFPKVEDEENTFYWENALDNYYALKLREAAKKVNRSDYRIIKELLFFSMEMNRLMWVYRLRYHYELSLEETLAYIPNLFGILTRTKYHSLLEQTTPGEFFEELYHLNLIDNQVTDLNELETEMNRIIVKRAMKYRTQLPFSIGLLLSYILLKSMNVRTYIILLEGKKHGLEKNTIRRMLAV